MYSVNIHEAKTRFSQLVEAAMRGEEIIIAKAGKPAAKLVPYISKTKRKIAGFIKAKFVLAMILTRRCQRIY